MDASRGGVMHTGRKKFVLVQTGASDRSRRRDQAASEPGITTGGHEHASPHGRNVWTAWPQEEHGRSWVRCSVAAYRPLVVS
jgi:hypothetical protein